jgi:hypothetical protein
MSRGERVVLAVKHGVLAVFFAGFVMLGGFGLEGIQYNPRITQPGPLSSSDSMLAKGVGIDRAAERIEACFQQLRSDRPVVVLLRKNSMTSAMFGQFASVLGWPRQVWFTEFSQTDADGGFTQALARDPEGLFFAGMPAAAGLGKTEELGGEIVFVRREAAAP